MFIFTSFLYADFKTISNENLEAAIKEGISVIDIRRLDEWSDTGVVPSSHKLTFFDEKGKYDLSKWMSQFEKIVKNKNQKFILVCRSARRTGIVGDFLSQKAGYKNVYHLEGGIVSWMKDNKKTVK
ncbi:hypothetical protein A9Q76_03005 [Arcobacter sp. 31_11_sub10_T18]|nr:hypothetical protein A9Q76_03005 [Arcobacter sp. 31_11_sub10_T18]